MHLNAVHEGGPPSLQPREPGWPGLCAPQTQEPPLGSFSLLSRWFFCIFFSPPAPPVKTAAAITTTTNSLSVIHPESALVEVG